MTPCEKLGYKVGDRFEFVQEWRGIKAGSQLTLHEDDGSHRPWFRDEYDKPWSPNLDYVKKINQEWNGEGLPPAGTVCEYNTSGEYKSGKIACHLTEIKGDVLIAFQIDGGGYALTFNTSLFRPIRSAREKAIDEMAKDASIAKTTASINLLGSLYDAGYRKP